MKVDIGMIQKMTSPNLFALVSTERPDGGCNLMALSWWMYVSNHPATIAICLSKKGWSGELIARSKEFGLNVVDEVLEERAFSCGTCSGRNVDKPSEFGIELCDAEVIKAKLVKDTKIALECQVKNVVEVSDHNLFIAEIVAMKCDPEKKQLYAWEGYKKLRSV